MLLGITPNLHYVRTYATESKQVVKGVLPVNGVQEKHKWLHQPIKKQVVDIVDKEKRCDTCECYDCDCEECNCECHETEEVQGVPV